MVSNWKKQNINFLEIMFTDYCIINPLYKDMWEELFPLAEREKVARYDLRQAIRSMAHQAIHTIKQDPADLKKLMNTARIANSLARLVTHKEMPYKNVIWQNDTVRGIRTNETPVPICFVDDMILYFESMIEKAENWEATDEELVEKGKVNCFLDELILDLIDYRLSL